MLVDNSYFNGDLLITGINNPGRKSGLDQQLDNFIKKWERKLLVCALGYDLYSAFIEGLDAGTIEQKWIDLRDGKEYEIEGKKVYFNGISAPNDKCNSVIAQFIYYQWKRHYATNTTNTGEVSPDEENSSRKNGVDKMVFVWNELFLPYYQGDRSGNHCGCEISTCCHSYTDVGCGERSLYDFISDQNNIDSETYPNWNFRWYETLNRWSL